MGNYSLLFFFGFTFLFCSMVWTGSAGECAYGSVSSWFCSANGPWENATAHPCLKKGQEFEIKIVVTTKTNLQVFFVKLHEFGTPVFEVVNGPSDLEQILECRQSMKPGQTFTYRWKLRVLRQTTWVNGYSPLEVYAQFNINDAVLCSVCYDVLVGYIMNDSVNCSSDTSELSHDTSGDAVPGFEGVSLIGVVFLFSIFRKTLAT